MSLHSILSDRSSIALLLALTLLRTMPLGASTQSHHFLIALKILQSAIYGLIGLKLIKALNQWVTRRSINNFVDDPTWDWPKETAVVTGGSSGIGAEIVRELAERKIKTIILDINKPISKLGTYIYVHSNVLHVQILTQRRRCDFLPSQSRLLLSNIGICIHSQARSWQSFHIDQ